MIILLAIEGPEQGNRGEQWKNGLVSWAVPRDDPLQSRAMSTVARSSEEQPPIVRSTLLTDDVEHCHRNNQLQLRPGRM